LFCSFCGEEIPSRLTSVGFCPFCGKTLTEGEPPVAEVPRADEQPSQAILTPPVASEKSTRKRQILAILGASLLFAGVFLPIVSVPIVGSLNYFHNGQGDGTIVLALAVITTILAVTRRFRGLWVTGLCSVGLLLFDLINFTIRMSRLRAQMQAQLAGNPFKGLAEIAMNSVQLQWGWAVLVLGGAMIVVAAALRGPRTSVSRPATGARVREKWIGASVAVFLLLLGLASLLKTGHPLENNPFVQGTPSTPSATTSELAQGSHAKNAAAAYPHFSDGIHVVGQDVSPGTYRTRVGSPGCYYARLAGFDGTSEDIISNENTDAPAVVTISPADKGFESHGCGIWTEDLSPITSSRTTFRDGIYIVGTDIRPGTYRSTGGQGCYYARLSGFGGVTDEVIANENTDSPAVVSISATDAGFKSAGCGIWTLISGAGPSPGSEVTSMPGQQAGIPGTGVPSQNGAHEVGTGEPQDPFSRYAAHLQSVAVGRGYQPVGEPVIVDADSEGGKLLIQQAVCDNSPGAHCQKLFVAFNDRFLGTDTYLPSWEVYDVKQEGVGSFSALYEDLSSPAQTPPPVKVVYTWNGQKLTASAIPPTRPAPGQTQVPASPMRPNPPQSLAGVNPSVGEAKIAVPQAAQPAAIEIPAGTKIEILTVGPIASDVNHTGDILRGRLYTPLVVAGQQVVLTKGALIFLRVLQILSAHHRGELTEIRLVLDHLDYGGRNYPLDSSSFDLANSSGKRIRVSPGTTIKFQLLGPVNITSTPQNGAN
jgi:hypothetical protein